jgi:phosphatidate cytidylyltransferase
MLKTRVITAVILLAILLPILFSGSPLAFTCVASLFLGAAMWESQRLFNKPGALMIAVVWAIMFVYLSLQSANFFNLSTLFIVCVLFWVFGLVPSLKFGLPSVTSFSSGLISGVYAVTIFGCFVAMNFLFNRSVKLLLSSMMLVWIADIGAYFCGKAFGKRKLAITISPGKSWEGAIGGWLAVLIFGAICVLTPSLSETFPARLFTQQGWLVLALVLSAISVASVVGDLFESLLKRRVQVKDSSFLLPGHGGVLDRIDALIPVMPFAALLTSFWNL